MVKVQAPLDGIVPPKSVAILDAAASDPPQVVVGAGELLMVTLLGSISVRAALVSEYAFEFRKVIVSVETPF
jgi:hypothetical protein